MRHTFPKRLVANIVGEALGAAGEEAFTTADIYGGLTNDKLQGCAGVVKRVVAKAAVAGNALVVCGGGGARKEQRRAVI
jgi:hypothetical protein